MIKQTRSINFKNREENFISDRLSSQQLNDEDQKVILVGGGSILVNPEKSHTLKGAEHVVCPDYYQVIISSI